mgnify:CR=1 FL=1
MINLILFGPPGSGKGTQAEKLKAHFNLLHISEVYITKNNSTLNKENFSNKQLISNTISNDYSVISSPNENFTINTYIVLPNKIKKDEEIMIQSIANQVEMFYIIFTSIYYKNKL